MRSMVVHGIVASSEKICTLQPPLIELNAYASIFFANRFSQRKQCVGTKEETETAHIGGIIPNPNSIVVGKLFLQSSWRPFTELTSVDDFPVLFAGVYLLGFDREKIENLHVCYATALGFRRFQNGRKWHEPGKGHKHRPKRKTNEQSNDKRDFKHVLWNMVAHSISISIFSFTHSRACYARTLYSDAVFTNIHIPLRGFQFD